MQLCLFSAFFVASNNGSGALLAQSIHIGYQPGVFIMLAFNSKPGRLVSGLAYFKANAILCNFL